MLTYWRSARLLFFTCIVSIVSVTHISVSLNFPGREQIISFNSDITVHTDASMTVHETITVWSTGTIIKRGITRSFPTRYTDRFDNRYIVDFKIVSITQNGNPIPYTIKKHENGEIVHIGNPDRLISPGKHVYHITYTTNRQLGFFPEQNKNELYWNVTGLDTVFTINNAKAQVTLPATVPANTIAVEAYTGPAGSKAQHYTASVTPQGKAVITTTKPLQPHENLTIVVSWPLGYIAQPNFWTKLYYFLMDNLAVLWLALGLLLLLIYYLFAYISIKRKEPASVIIPLFTPPADVSPGAVGFLTHRSYDSKSFASELVNMAVHGLLTIDYKKGYLWGGTYTLNKKEYTGPISPMHQNMLNSLFKHKTHVAITSANGVLFEQAQTCFIMNNPISYNYLDSHTNWILGGLLLTGLIALPLLITQTFYASFIVVVVLGLGYLITHVIFYKAFQGYTRKGRKLMDQIEGFKMFLATTETERLKMIGTPPTKTPELYEKYLPYAIALGVEKQWSQQFAPVFDKLKKEGHAYQPVWLHGMPLYAFNPTALNNSITSALPSQASKISSGGSIPGSSSGGGGRGSSGGGGGGGGVGGW